MPNNTARTLIIAEAGVNHNGSLELAKQLVDAAALAGADIVKFQTSVTSTSKFSEKAEYQKRETGAEETQLEMIKKLRFSFAQHVQLKEYCDRIGIKYFWSWSFSRALKDNFSISHAMS